MGIRVDIGANIDASQVTDAINKMLGQWDSATDEMKRAINDALGGTTTKTVEIQFKEDGSGLKQAVAVERERYSILDQIQKQYEKETKAQAGSLTNLRQSLNTATQLRDATAKYVREIDNGVLGVARINGEWVKANSEVQKLKAALGQASNSGFFDRIGNAFNDSGISKFLKGIGNLVQGFQAVQIILQQVSASFNTFVNAQKKIQGLDLTFKSIGQGAQGGSNALQKAAEISQNLGVGLDTTINAFKQLSPVVLNSGGSMDDVAKITESLSSRFVAFGKSADESKRVLNAIIQAFGKGKLQAEELNQQISEADPAFRTDLAQAIGVSTAELEKMVKAGKITSEMLIDILPKMDKTAQIFKLGGLNAEQAARSLGMLDEAGNQIGPTLEQISNKIDTVNQLTLIDVSGQFDKLIKAIFVIQAAFADFFAEVGRSSVFKALADVIGDLAIGFANVLSVLLDVTSFFISVLTPVGEFVTAVSNLSIGFTTLGEAIGTIVAIGLTAWFAKWIAESIKGALELGKLGTQLLGNLAGKAKEVIATNASTAANDANTASLAKNTQALIANRAAGAVPKAPPIPSLPALPPASGEGLSSLAKSAKEFSTIAPVTVRDLGEINKSVKLLPPATTAAANGMKLLPPAATAAASSGSTLKNILQSLKGGLVAIDEALLVAFKGMKNFGLGVARFLVSPLGLAVLAIAAVGNVIGMYKTAVSGADAANKQYGAGVSELNKIIDQHKAKTAEAGSAQSQVKSQWESSKDAVGGFYAVLDKGYRLIGLNTLEQAQYTQSLIGTNEAYDEFQGKVSQADGIIKQMISTMGSDVEKRKEAQATIDGVTTALKNQIAEEQKGIAILKQRKAGGDAEQAGLNELIATKERQVQTMTRQIKAYESQAQKAGLATQATKDEIAAAKEALKIQQLREQLVTQRANVTIEDTKAKWEQEKAAIESTQAKAQEYFEALKRGNEDAKTSEDRRHNAVKQGLEDEKTEIQERYDIEKALLDELKTKIEETYNARLEKLRDPTASEAALKELEIAELQRQAVQGTTNEERLRAKAQLERIAADKQAAEVEKQKKAELAALEKQQKEQEKQKEAELAAIKKKERDEDRAHQQTMEALQQQSVNLQRAAADSAKKAKEDEQKLAEKYGPTIKQAEQEIQAEKAKTEAAQARVKAMEEGTKDEINEATGAQQAHTNAIGESADAIRDQLIRNLDEYANKIRNLPKIPPAPQTNFAGGHVGPGLVGTVNELGKEAFLSDSGKLSWINKPAWSKWVAPSSGTIIPAHIAAGLDIPSGGTNINNSTVRSMNRTTNSNMNYRSMARLLGAALGANTGTVNNSVVINSDRPVKAASDMLVAMTKIRRNRYS